MEISGLEFDLSPGAGMFLERLWRDLETRADCPFFLTWDWIGTWLAQTPNLSPLVLTVRDRETVVALALFQPARLKRRFAQSRALLLQQSGDPYTDIITIEYNGVLADRRYSDLVMNNFMVFLKQVKLPGAVLDNWDEIHVATAIETVARTARDAKLMVLELKHKPSWFVSLDSIRQNGGDFIGTLSSNTRYQIRRAIRLYAESGPVKTERAKSLDEAFAYFAELKELHQTYWNGRGMPGGFSNMYFEKFHLALIGNCFPRGTVQLIRVTAGSKLIGVVYNFAYRGRIYAYQTGFAYEQDSKIKPGLVSHYLCIQRCLEEGAAIYDFMAGDSRYKSSLGVRGPDMMHFVFQRRTAARVTEAFLRQLNDWRRGVAVKLHVLRSG